MFPLPNESDAHSAECECMMCGHTWWTWISKAEYTTQCPECGHTVNVQSGGDDEPGRWDEGHDASEAWRG